MLNKMEKKLTGAFLGELWYRGLPIWRKVFIALLSHLSVNMVTVGRNWQKLIK